MNELGKKRISLLDLGCGNGRFAIPFAQKLGYEITAIDNSEAMIEVARKNDGNNLIKWEVQDASRLSFAENSFDAIWISHLLHLVDDPISILRECYRVLKSNGKLIIRYTTREDNSLKPERHFFPELIEQDKLRMPSKSDVKSWFNSIEFKDVSSRNVMIPVYNQGIERVQKAKQRAESGFAKLSDSAFQKGIIEFEAYVNSHPNDEWILQDNYSVTTALKRE